MPSRQMPKDDLPVLCPVPKRTEGKAHLEQGLPGMAPPGHSTVLAETVLAEQ